MVRSMRTPETIEEVCELVTSDCQLAIQILAIELNISKEVVQQISIEDLEKCKVCSRFILHCVSEDESKSEWTHVVNSSWADPAFLDLIVTSLWATNMILKGNDRAPNGCLHSHQDSRNFDSKNPKSRLC